MMELSSKYRVKEWLISQIKSGELKPGHPLPSTLGIARALDVKTDDVYDGIAELIAEQVLTEHVEEGPRVKHLRPFYYPLGELVSISKMIESQGYHSGTEYIALDEIPATTLDADILQLELKSLVTQIERIRTADGAPLVFCIDKVATSHLTCQAFQQNNEGSILDAMKQYSNIDIKHVEVELDTVSYEPHISDNLDAMPHESLMLLKIVHYDTEGNPVLYSLNYFRSSLVKFKTTNFRYET
ncbi:GntR family transcriptional regulator [Staphylococcus auricularis]|uniref:GntR family transcriptional regulator n=1 Tax=Staphylococcus auricularis TaxID=29379 RepID=UPI002431660A|nr:GntR family transcriptional regulator [Staphylococcus auricularis]